MGELTDRILKEQAAMQKQGDYEKKPISFPLRSVIFSIINSLIIGLFIGMLLENKFSRSRYEPIIGGMEREMTDKTSQYNKQLNDLKQQNAINEKLIADLEQKNQSLKKSLQQLQKVAESKLEAKEAVQASKKTYIWQDNRGTIHITKYPPRGENYRIISISED